jgi:YD repeat-containing protein
VLGRVAAVTRAAGAALAQTTTANDVTSQTDRDGRRRDFGYDALNRAPQETWTVDTMTAGTITSTRDADGNVLTLTNAAGTLTFTYDALNRVSTATDVFGTLMSYAYDPRGLKTAVTDSACGTDTYTYDAAGQTAGQTVSQTGLGVPGSVSATYGYNAAGSCR